MVIDPTPRIDREPRVLTQRRQEAAAGARESLAQGRPLTQRAQEKFFERLKNDGDAADGPEWLSTHPSTDARIARLDELQDVAKPTRVLSDDQLAALKMACLGSDGAGDSGWGDGNGSARETDAGTVEVEARESDVIRP